MNEKESFVQAGVYYGTGSFNTKDLGDMEKQGGTLNNVKSFCHHFYSQSSSYNLSRLINHAQIISDLKQFEPEAEKARELGKDFVFGETNSGEIAFTFSVAMKLMLNLF